MVDRGATAIAIISIRRVGTPSRTINVPRICSPYPPRLRWIFVARVRPGVHDRARASIYLVLVGF